MRVVLATAVAVALAVACSAFAQPDSSSEREVEVEQLPLSLERIEDELRTPPAISLASTEPLFRVEIVAPRQNWLGNIDWLGTTERVAPDIPFPSIHEQYLARVTPPEARTFGAFEGAELFQVMVTSLIQGLAARKVVDAAKEAARKRREEQARREVDEAIARWRDQLERQRQGGGRGSPEDDHEHENTKIETTK